MNSIYDVDKGKIIKVNIDKFIDRYAKASNIEKYISKDTYPNEVIRRFIFSINDGITFIPNDIDNHMQLNEIYMDLRIIIGVSNKLKQVK